jgi:hypothetical protein
VGRKSSNAHNHYFGMQVHSLFRISALNILWTMMSGTRYARDDEELQSILKGLDKIFRSGTQSGRFLDTFPIFRRFLPESKAYKESVDCISNLRNFVKVCSTKNWCSIIIITALVVVAVVVVEVAAEAEENSENNG